MSDPQFVSLEGVDKTGKTLIYELLKTEASGAEYVTDPTGISPWGDIFTNGPELHQFAGTDADDRIPGISRSFVFLTARLHCYSSIIQPALENGRSAIADRFSDSWLTYQSVHREDYFADTRQALEFFQTIHSSCVEAGLLCDPDLTILITIDQSRLESRLSETNDRTEYEQSSEKLMRVQELYLDLLNEHPDRFYRIHDSGQGVTAIYEEVRQILAERGVL